MNVGFPRLRCNIVQLTSLCDFGIAVDIPCRKKTDYLELQFPGPMNDHYFCWFVKGFYWMNGWRNNMPIDHPSALLGLEDCHYSIRFPLSCLRMTRNDLSLLIHTHLSSRVALPYEDCDDDASLPNLHCWPEQLKASLHGNGRSKEPPIRQI